MLSHTLPVTISTMIRLIRLLEFHESAVCDNRSGEASGCCSEHDSQIHRCFPEIRYLSNDANLLDIYHWFCLSPCFYRSFFFTIHVNICLFKNIFIAAISAFHIYLSIYLSIYFYLCSYLYLSIFLSLSISLFFFLSLKYLCSFLVILSYIFLIIFSSLSSLFGFSLYLSLFSFSLSLLSVSHLSLFLPLFLFSLYPFLPIVDCLSPGANCDVSSDLLSFSLFLLSLSLTF
ncbi:unnamed protein product [Acanthosepion pharaonis]|uniref:Uncharacterized protein n=1 Tax=Acanthosepion pharaonis TaxID=158019 RepID=A0A812ANC5_ACAPH|nr:unnamed protein product [Sepia pharaonis]